jgi:hypothetical protein
MPVININGWYESVPMGISLFLFQYYDAKVQMIKWMYLQMSGLKFRRFGAGRPKSEDRSPKTEVRRPKSEDRSPKTEVRRPKSEDRRPKTEVRRPKSEVRSPKSEDCSTKTEERGLKSNNHNSGCHTSFLLFFSLNFYLPILHFF